MNTSRGFVSVLILLIVVGIAVLGGVGWWAIANKEDSQQAAQGTSTTTDISKTLQIRVQGTEAKVVKYEISGELPKDTNVWLGLVNGTTGVELWGMEDARVGANTIDLKTLDKFGTPITVPSGDYTLRLREFHSGKSLAESDVFTILIPSPPILTVTNVNPNGIELTVEYKNMPKEVRSLFLCIPSGGCTEWGVEFSPTTQNGIFTMTMLRPEGSTKTMGKGTFTVEAVDFSTGKVFVTSKPFTVQ